MSHAELPVHIAIARYKGEKPTPFLRAKLNRSLDMDGPIYPVGVKGTCSASPMQRKETAHARA